MTGSHVICDDEHLWITVGSSGHSGYRTSVRSTDAI